ncbi:MAG TPA: Bax inhibitor-1/YccA family protein [Nocardioides sp.]|uniref:Putative YccA/Bax inhibitor family protein n=1 Tax=Nocardioides daedukensis TaxID=634462 RepID=A0A7Y9UPQ0_9ACTN|nr:Bax inhibitor-1/YccA family protein [Nocardioides daedukensis]NYG58482.1 putative YccA/Bax inhibitor family protein [Nocardioides daedukensis]
MKSNNPVFNRSAEFNGQAGYGQTMTDPSQWGTGAPGYQQHTDRMTIDSVVQKTGISLGVVIVVAMATWILTPEVTAQADLSPLIAAMTIGSLGAFALSMVNSFKRVISPPLVLAFAALEGVALGALSKYFNVFYEGNVVMGAVIGTFAAFAGTLAAYKFFNIKVSGKFRMFVTAAVFGMIGLAVLEMVLSLFGAQIGLFGVSGLGMVTAFAGLILGVFMLIMDFDFVERGIAAGLEERESWRAAFAMTVSLVWIYTNLLRILAFFSQD